jgi:cobalt-zinc-cadmium efflux system outer membrane protein
VPIPLFDQGQSARATAAGELRAARQRYAGLAVETRAAARAAAQRLRSARDRAIYQRTVILPLRQQILDETQKHYNAMQVGAFQLLQARQAQIDAAAAYIESLREYWLARVEVDQVINGAAGGAAASSPAARPPTAQRRSDDEGGH